ncbi:MAG: glycosyltransferase [Planctomycetaceae bacterium]|nr:glycosyltransferase [Planctomycetaceae bacterium]MBT6156017.1 glycosyltransferase [Planctomycetaceae bacterium]MBT6487542.1 glycosyltransferase [Planctomycetaceae bacterium]MBT6498203.1 glycosyltransferase [Planctomycetaceae bacterium]
MTESKPESEQPDGPADHTCKAAERWLAEFRERTGRAPKVLHIGNIANNAYLNSKLLREAGLQCDVICYDYLHIMGCPEWEEADFEGGYLDDFFPAWERVKMGGYKRPHWFAQGRQDTCIRYLTAARQGRAKTARLLRMRLILECRLISWMGRKGLLPLAAKVRRAVGLLPRLLWRAPKKLVCRGLKQLLWPQGRPVPEAPDTLDESEQQPQVHCERSASQSSSEETQPLVKERLRPTSEEPFDRRAAALVECFKQVFPEREDALISEELMQYSSVVDKWSELFDSYDVIVGYSTDPLLPLLAGNRPYLAFEHGTIRNIPFQPTTQGRLCAISYRLADVSLITNCDNYRSAERLRLPNYRFIPHPVNESPVPREAAAKIRESLEAEFDCDFVVFHPSRQHWEPDVRHPDWEKGNDIFFRGLARFITETNSRAMCVCVAWGNSLEQSKQLLTDLGIADRVKWIKPQSSRQMVSYIQASDVTADQFYLGAFGSTLPKAMLHGCPGMLYIDAELHDWAFPEIPPVLNTRTSEDVFSSLERLYLSVEERERLARLGREWYLKYHSNQVIARGFVEAIRDAIQPVEQPADQSEPLNREAA